MDKSRTTYRETRFRTPIRLERELEIWVDRLGSGGSGNTAGNLRILGQFAVIAVDTGEGILSTGDNGGDQRLTEGDVILLTPDLAANYWTESNWYTRWIVWNGPEAERLRALHFLESPTHVLHHASLAVNRAYFALVPLMRQEDRLALLQRKTILLQMILELHRSLQVARGSHMAHTLGRQVETFLEQHLASDFSIEELARQFDLSASQFRRLFKRYSGMSPREYVNTRRLSRAKELLAQGASIQETTEAVGFHDMFYFMRLFKLQTGETAGEFARKNLG